jgi:hypothetical protein
MRIKELPPHSGGSTFILIIFDGHKALFAYTGAPS